MGYLPSFGEKPNPLKLEDRKALGKLSDRIISMYVHGYHITELKQRLDKLGIDGIFRLIHSCNYLSKYTGGHFEDCLKNIEAIGGVDYLVQELTIK